MDEKATQLHAIASLKVLLDATKPQRGAATSSAANHVKINLKETTLGRPNGNIDTALDSVWYKEHAIHIVQRCMCAMQFILHVLNNVDFLLVSIGGFWCLQLSEKNLSGKIRELITLLITILFT